MLLTASSGSGVTSAAGLGARREGLVGLHVVLGRLLEHRARDAGQRREPRGRRLPRRAVPLGDVEVVRTRVILATDLLRGHETGEAQLLEARLVEVQVL